MSIRLVLADVDGTLVTQEKVLTERTTAAVRRLGEAVERFILPLAPSGQGAGS